MNKIPTNRLGFAFGITGAAFYLACTIFMVIVPATTVVWFSNSLLHGVDGSSIMRESIPIGQSVGGVLSTYAGSWIFGVLAACLNKYGLSGKSEHE